MTLSYLQTSLDKLSDAARDDVIEICINPDGSCWGEFQGDHFMRALDQRLSVTEVRDLGNQIASSANTTMSKDKPIVSVSITYRDRPIRAQVVTPPAVLAGMSISLRFFSSLPLDKIELHFLYGEERKLEELRQEKNRALREVVASGDIYAAIRFCVENKLNMIVSGGTSTGKTVAARKILSYVPDEERIVTIEEAAELLPAQPNAVTLIANRDAEFQSADVLLTATLRMRPDRIILGEVRGPEALDLIGALNTGHRGSMSTVHANSPDEALWRLETLALSGDRRVAEPAVRRQLYEAVDLVIQVCRDGTDRRVAEVAEVTAGGCRMVESC